MLQTLGPIDRTPGIPGSDKNVDCYGTHADTRYELREIQTDCHWRPEAKN